MQGLDANILQCLQDLLDAYKPYIQNFRIYFASIVIGDGCDINLSNRDIVLKLRDEALQRISELHPSYDPLQYVLLFPNGDDGCI